MNDQCQVLVTGANGFVGSFLLAALHGSSLFSASAGLRKKSQWGVEGHVVGELTADTDWSSALARVGVVVHCAARVHKPCNDDSNTVKLWRQINVDGTLNLARQAAGLGVKRFIFLSSIGVNGNESDRPLLPEDSPAPKTHYAMSKLAAEQGLRDIHQKTGMEVVIIRPPLVYGPSAPGNFGFLNKVLDTGLPLPLAGIHNKRSFVSVWNLVDLIMICIVHPNAAGEVFLCATDRMSRHQSY